MFLRSWGLDLSYQGWIGKLGIWMAKCGGGDGRQSCLSLDEINFLSALIFWGGDELCGERRLI